MYEDDWDDDGYAWENDQEDEWEGYCRTCNEHEQNCTCDLEEETCGAATAGTVGSVGRNAPVVRGRMPVRLQL